MRIRAVVAIVALLSPIGLSAQRIPIPLGRRGPARPAELPPQPEPIARELMMRRWRLSVESYPLVSYVQSPGLSGARALSTWTTFGTGTRADYLLTRNVSATLDMTSSFLGGPAITNTAELGTRLHPEWAEHKLYPFVDLRVGYIASYNRGLGSYGDPFPYGNLQGTYIVRYSSGFGAIGGVGMEYSLTPRWSLTTAGSVLQTRLTAHDFESTQPVAPAFGMTSFRFTVGVRYNPVRVMRAPDVR